MFNTINRTALMIGILASVGAHPASANASSVSYDWFEYSGVDDTLDRALEAGEYHNPILTGFYPDPSICRVGDDYYLTNSTFAYFPGLPIFHSKDLLNWNLIGHAIDRPDQLRYDGLGVSRGIFAPAITQHEGTFYLVGTMVDSDGNFVMTAEDPAGPWSDPYILHFPGIDPSLFFDDDGRAWIVNNDDPDGTPLYEGHRAIRIQEFDLEAMQVKGPRPVLVDGGVDISTKPIWIEGPHIYKRNGWYYLSCAEGGTGPDHSQVIFRSREVTGPYEPWDQNPILTQRHLSPHVPGAVTAVGHADLEIGPDGNWWATFLGIRPYDGQSSPMGRETFLLPVEWTEDGWPTFPLGEDERVPLYLPTPGGVELRPSQELPLAGNFSWRDEFDDADLFDAWIMLRSPHETWWTVETENGGRLTLQARAETLSGSGNPSYLGRRVQHHVFQAATLLETPQSAAVSAGMALFQSEAFHYFLGVRTGDRGRVVFLERVREGEKELLKALDAPGTGEIALRVRGDKDSCAFEYSLDQTNWKPLLTAADAKMITTAVAGGFVGATVGPHARLDE